MGGWSHREIVGNADGNICSGTRREYKNHKHALNRNHTNTYTEPTRVVFSGPLSYTFWLALRSSAMAALLLLQLLICRCSSKTDTRTHENLNTRISFRISSLSARHINDSQRFHNRCAVCFVVLLLHLFLQLIIFRSSSCSSVQILRYDRCDFVLFRTCDERARRTSVMLSNVLFRCCFSYVKSSVSLNFSNL